MNLMITVGGTKNLGMDIGMQILNMILITITIMSIREDGGSMMKEMTVGITINILIMLRWKMTITLNEQNLNRVIGTETVIRTMIIIAQRGLILENMITSNLSTILNFSAIYGFRHGAIKSTPKELIASAIHMHLRFFMFDVESLLLQLW